MFEQWPGLFFLPGAVKEGISESNTLRLSTFPLFLILNTIQVLL